MWIILKIVVVLVAFFLRLYKKRFKIQSEANVFVFEGISCYTRLNKNKNSVNSTIFNLKIPQGFIFKLSKENFLDRFFKSVGISQEIQSGNKDFDEKVYIACDSSEFAKEIQNDEQTRKLILQLFSNDCSYISCDGENFSVQFPGSKEGNDELKKTLIQLYRQISTTVQYYPNFFKDPFTAKVLLIESLIWSLVAYAFFGFFEWSVFSEDLHLHQKKLFMAGISLGGFLALGLIFLIVTILNKSSRAHRIVIESSFALLLSLPLSGIQLISDINTNLDQSTPEIFEAKVVNKYFTTHKRRRGGTTYTYYMNINVQDLALNFEMPSKIKISRSLYDGINTDTVLNFEVGHGYLNHKWYKRIAVK